MSPETFMKLFMVDAELFFITLMSLVTYPNGNLAEYYKRSCQGKAWKLRFPAANNDEIRKFLSLFADAFLVPQKQRLQFTPDDKLLDICRSIYPSKWMADTLEFNFFAVGFKDYYNIDLNPIWHENTTLGDLFALAHAA